MHRLLALAALPALAGCPLLELQTSTQEVCVTYHDVTVPAAPGRIAARETSFTLAVPTSIAQLAAAHADVAFSRAVIHATSGVDLAFVEAATVTLVPADGSLPAIQAAACEACAATGVTLALDAADPVDAAPYIAASPLTVTVALTGAPPDHAWTMDLEVCVNAAVDYTLNP